MSVPCSPSSNTSPGLPAGPAQATRPIPLPVRRRADLVLVDRSSPTETRWVVKDPATLRFYELGLAEAFVLRQLDGTTSADELEARFARTFAPQRLSRQQLLEFVGRLWQQGLLTSLNAGGGAALHARRLAQESPSLLTRLSGLMTFRVRGVDPDRFLTALHSWVGWIFSPIAIGLAIALIGAAVLLMAVEFDSVIHGLPDLQSFLSVRNIVVGAILLGAIKVLHELGHGLTCKHFGGECHELGFLWLIVTPALYCNVSDSWMLPSRWQRAAVSAAGIFVELVLAAAFAFLWFFSEPGVFHDTCFWGMTIGSVNTLLINGNPLMRYDGYYVLSDLLDIPNLRSRSRRELGGTLSSLVLGVRRRGRHPWNARRLLLLGFGLASWLYQWVVLIAILWFLYHLARPVGLDPLVVGFAGLLLGGRVLAIARQGVARFQAWKSGGDVRTLRFLFGLVLLAGGGWLLATCPFPHSVIGPAILGRAEARTLFAVTPGFLETTASPGSVPAGEPLVLLSNPDLALEILKLEGAVERLEKGRESLSRRVVTEPHLSAQLAAVDSSLRDQRERLRSRKSEAERLRVTSPVGGKWIPLTLSESGVPLSAERSLRHVDWGDPRLRGTWVPAGTPLAEVAPSENYEARVFVEQSDLPFVRVGQAVRIKTGQIEGSVLEGKVAEVAARNVESIPPKLVMRHHVAAQPAQQPQSGPGGRPVVAPRDVLYEVRITIDDPQQAIVAHGTGEARIEVGQMTLWQRLLRFLSLTFRIREGGPVQ